jgi:hypothetical protein
LCNDTGLIEILDLGNQEFTGIFPLPEESVPSGQLKLLFCQNCGLGQLADSFPSELLYGENYGYRSGLNQSMVSHLTRISGRVSRQATLTKGDVVLDIGSNDCTLLNSYNVDGLIKVGIDPTSNKFSEYYPKDTIAIADFFSKETFFANSSKKPKVVTSIAMLYDLENPVKFAQDIHDILHDDGIWTFEQSYALWMLKTGSYDTICHEHLEYYTLSTIKKILDRANLRIIDATTNSTNGGSISVSAVKVGNSKFVQSPTVQWILEMESKHKAEDIQTWKNFASIVADRQFELKSIVEGITNAGKSLIALGASTKGNVLLQTMSFNEAIIPVVGDVNPYKFGRTTPGTNIPIEEESKVIARNPDFALVLPWHFKETFLKNLDQYLINGGRLVFPLPEVEVVGF